MQAKTTKKIVLRLQCNVCKAVHMHAIKVRSASRVRWCFLSCAEDHEHVIRALLWCLQRCKHFEIGGEKKHKSAVY